MKKQIIFNIIVLFALTSSIYAETYKRGDEEGTLRFSDNPPHKLTSQKKSAPFPNNDRDEIESYLNNLSSTNIDTRIKAARELAIKHHIKGVRLALKDPEKKVRRVAISSLSIKPLKGRGRDPEAVAIFIESLKDIDRDVRFGALCKLGDFSREASSHKIDMDPDICHSIAGILDDPDQNLRSLAVSMLKDCRVKSIENKLLHIAEDNKEPLRIRRIAIVHLSKSNIKGLDEKLIRILKDVSEDNKIKEMAISSLGKLKSSRAVDVIIPYLYDKDHILQFVAAQALGAIGDPKASNALADVIIDSKGKVNSVVLTSLEKTASPVVLPKLLEIKPLLDSRGLKRKFLRALGATGSDSAVEPLLSFIIDDPDDAVQSSASQVLRQFESQTALKTIIDASKKEPGNKYLSSLAKGSQHKLDFPAEALERKKKKQEKNIVNVQEREINKIYNTGRMLFRDKKYEKALPYFYKAVDEFEKLYTSYPAYFRSSLNQIRRIRGTLAGYYRWKIKSPEKAVTEYMKLISTVNKFETDERWTSPYWFTLGEVYEKDLKDYQKAQDCYKKFSELAEPKDNGHDRNEEILYKQYIEFHKWYIDWIAFLQEKIRVMYLKKQQAFSHRTLKYPNMEYGFSTASLGLAFVITEADFANEFDEGFFNSLNTNTYNSIEVLDKLYAKYSDSYRAMFFGTGLFHHCLVKNKIDDALLVADRLIKTYPYDLNMLMLQFEISDVYKIQKNNQKHKEAIDKGLKMAKSMNIDIVLSPDRSGSFIYYEDAFNGKVIDIETKEPIEGAVVAAIYDVTVRGLVDSGSAHADVQETLTDSKGEFHIPSNTFFYPSPFTLGGERTEFIIYKPGYGTYPGFNTFRIFPVKEALRKHDDTNVTVGREGIIFERTLKNKDAFKLYRKKFDGYLPFIPLKNPIERIRNLDLPFDADVFKVERIYNGRIWASYKGEPFKTYALIGLPKVKTMKERKKSHSRANKIPPGFESKVPLWDKTLDDEYDYLFKRKR